MFKIQNSKQNNRFRKFGFRIMSSLRSRSYFGGVGNLFRLSNLGFRISMRKEGQSGFIALISVLIIGAVILVISIGLSLRSIGETNMALNKESSNRAASLSDACAENALLKLKTNLSYNGGETVTVQSGLTCQILTVLGSGNTSRTIQTQSTVSGYTAKTQVVISQVNPNTLISSWERMGDF